MPINPIVYRFCCHRTAYRVHSRHFNKYLLALWDAAKHTFVFDPWTFTDFTTKIYKVSMFHGMNVLQIALLKQFQWKPTHLIQWILRETKWSFEPKKQRIHTKNNKFLVNSFFSAKNRKNLSFFTLNQKNDFAVLNKTHETFDRHMKTRSIHCMRQNADGIQTKHIFHSYEGFCYF